MFLDEHTGLGVTVAVIDSGVHAAHPHVGGVSGGVGIRHDGTLDPDYVDRIGHGTAVTAAIREKAPDAAIIAVKVFWDTLATDVATLARAMDEASARGAAILNMSLGTPELRHASALEQAVALARRRGALVVAAFESDGTVWLPGSLDGVVGVVLDWSCPRGEYRLIERDGRSVIAASGYPRDIPGVPRERNLKGISFAVANATGFVARAREAAPGASSLAVLRTLALQTAPL